jgi:hypothetical protein
MIRGESRFFEKIMLRRKLVRQSINLERSRTEADPIFRGMPEANS